MADAKYLILGADGMLGRDLVRAVRAEGDACEAFVGLVDFDLADAEALGKSIDRVKPSVIINAAAYTDVDGAESDPQLADRLNHIGVGHLATICADRRIKLIHYSTDYVFPGNASSPYAIDAPTGPINVYGETKLGGELVIGDSGADHLIIRSSWLFAPHAKNFLLTMLHLMEERDELKVVNDQVGRPTLCHDLAAMTLKLEQNGARGVFHATNDGRCSWYEFAMLIAEAGRKDCRIEPCATSAFPRPARRPAYSVLDLTRTIDLIGVPRSWQEAVRACVRDVLAGGESTIG